VTTGESDEAADGVGAEWAAPAINAISVTAPINPSAATSSRGRETCRIMIAYSPPASKATAMTISPTTMGFEPLAGAVASVGDSGVATTNGAFGASATSCVGATACDASPGAAAAGRDESGVGVAREPL